VGDLAFGFGGGPDTRSGVLSSFECLDELLGGGFGGAITFYGSFGVTADTYCLVGFAFCCGCCYASSFFLSLSGFITLLAISSLFTPSFLVSSFFCSSFFSLIFISDCKGALSNGA